VVNFGPLAHDNSYRAEYRPASGLGFTATNGGTQASGREVAAKTPSPYRIHKRGIELTPRNANGKHN
jgi:hypothetical protein